LENDFEIGHYLKERVIPRAVLFFTGEIDEDLSEDDSLDYGADVYDGEMELENIAEGGDN
jgi:nucleosome assembly protein 1-like 1